MAPTDQQIDALVNTFMATAITDVNQLKNNQDQMKIRMELLVLKTQSEFCNALQALEPEKKWKVDRWQREQGGGGITCVMQDGKTFEKAGCNVSVVYGKLPEAAFAAMKARGHNLQSKEAQFFATGVSTVIHPKNPMVPTCHFNYRYFEVQDEFNNKLNWFGGGTDLTPYYVNEEDCVYFHQVLKDACTPHDPNYYEMFKKECDKYFYITHRKEARGVGGIFFDDMEVNEKNFAFVKNCAEATVPAYAPLVAKHKDDAYGAKERDWQLIRRGRYVEFNLIYDRGTKFGLNTPEARIESILMSLPLTANWEYMYEIGDDAEKKKLMDVVTTPKDWVPLR